MGRIHLKKRIKFKKKRIYGLIIIILVFCLFVFISKINKRYTPIIVEMAEIEINKFSTIIVNKAINQVLEDKINTDEIFSTVLSPDGKIQTIDFNPVVVNQVLNVATTVVQENLKLLEEGNLENIGINNDNLGQNKIDKLKNGIIAEIPIGVIFHNNLLSNIGPKIPIRLHYYGDVNSNIVTNVKPYGINNALVEVGIQLDMTAQIILPYTSKKMNLKCYIPLAIKVIQGIVPNYYSNGIEKDSQLYSLPF